MKPQHLAAALGAALALIAWPSFAARPLVTEDSDALAPADCEAETYAARISSRDGASLRAGVMQFGCGVGASTQLAAAYGHSRQAEDTSHLFTLSGKTQFRLRTADKPGLAFAYCLSGSRAEGDAFRTESTAVNLAASGALGGHGLLHGNIGWTRNRLSGHSATTWAVAAETSVAEGTDLVGEFYGDDRVRPWANAGVRWAASDRFSLNASYGLQFDDARVRVLTVGAKLAF